MRRGPSCPVQRRTDRDKAIDRGMIRAGARTRDPAVYVVNLPHDSQTTTTRRGRVVHHAGAGQPPPLRGAARLVRRRADLPAGRRPVRLHPLGDDQPGPRVAGRTAGAVRPHPQARPATGCRAGQGPGAGPGDPAAPPGAVHLRDLRAAGRRAHPAQPHQRRRAPRRGGVRPAAARPPARPQQLPGHRRPRHPPAKGPGHRPGRLAAAAGHHQGRAAAGAARPGRPGPAWSGPQGRLPQHPGHPRHLLATFAAGPQAHQNPAGVACR